MNMNSNEQTDGGAGDVDRAVATTANTRAIARAATQRLDAKESLFVHRVWEGVGIAEAYKQAFNSVAVSEKELERRANKVLALEHVQFALAKLKERAAETAEINVATVLKEIAMVAFADPSDAVQVRAYCCRHCHGFDHQYQWVNAEEFDRAKAGYARAKANAEKYNLTMEIAPPSDEGGYEFKKVLAPDPGCPHCDGVGDVVTRVKPTDKWKESTRRLVSGIKQGKNGIELTFRDQTPLLKMLAEYVGVTNRPALLFPGVGPQLVEQDSAAAEKAEQVKGLTDAELAQMKALLSKAVTARDNSAATDVEVRERVSSRDSKLPLDLAQPPDVPTRRP